MPITINFDTNLRQVSGTFGPEMQKALVKAARSALAKALKTLRTEANRAVREKMALKQGEINKDYFVMSKNLKGSKLKHLNDMSAELGVKAKPIAFIRLVRGSKKPRSQVNVSVKRRAKGVKVEIRKGKVIMVKHAFIARAKQGTYHVFKREPNTQSRGYGNNRSNANLRMQAAPSIHFLFLKDEFRRPIEQHAGKRLQELFIHEMNFFLAKYNK